MTIPTEPKALAEYAAAANEALRAYLAFFEAAKKVIDPSSWQWQEILSAGDKVLHAYGYAYFFCCESGCFPVLQLNNEIFTQDVELDFFFCEGLQ